MGMGSSRHLIEKIDLSNPEVAKEVLALQRASYQLEAELLEYDRLPPLIESLEQLMNCGETFIGYFDDQKIVGALSYKIIDEQIDLHRMMVHPDYLRQGIAKALFQFLSKEHDEVDEFIVSTGAANHPAIALYQKLGFKKVAETVVEAGLRIAHFKKAK